MPNFAVALKQEICRLARREIRAQGAPTRQAIVQYRHEIARLKRQIHDQQRKVAVLESRNSNGAAEVETEDDPLSGMRFSARSVRAQRRRLKLSAGDYGKLIGVSGLTVYNWEHGRTRPRAAQFEALTAVRGITRREVAAKLGIALPQRASRGRKPR